VVVGCDERSSGASVSTATLMTPPPSGAQTVPGLGRST
jgi:hypothetical protein